MVESNCPSCGAPMTFRSRASLYGVCGYCDSQVLRHDLDLETVGQVAHLQEDSTPLQLGTKGRLMADGGQRSFEIVGRIQLQFPRGYWNEWYLWCSDGKDAWLGEAQGLYVFTRRIPAPKELPRFSKINVGQGVQIDGQRFVVKEKQKGRCVGGEGELPFAVNSGYRAPVVDLHTHGRDFATLDYSDVVNEDVADGEILVFVGWYVHFGELALENLRPLDGWSAGGAR